MAISSTTASCTRSYSSHSRHIEQRFGGRLPFRSRILAELVYGSSTDNKNAWVAHYRAHNDDVRRTIPANQLLEIDVSQPGAYHSLCVFLNETSGECGDVDAAFPHENQHARLDAMGATKAYNWSDADRNGRYAYVSILDNEEKQLADLLTAVDGLRGLGAVHDVIALVQTKLTPEAKKYLSLYGIGIIKVHHTAQVTTHTAAHYMSRLRVFGLQAYRKIIYFAPAGK